MSDEEKPEPPDAALKRQAAIDAEDFNNELAGNDTGRMRRFLPADHAPLARQSREGRRYQDSLVLSEFQAQIQEDFRRRLDGLERSSRDALRRAEEHHEQMEASLRGIRENAAVDATGRRVYRTAHGATAFYEDGSQLTAEALAGITWKTGGATWEEYQQTAAATQAAADAVASLGDYLDRLHSAQERLDSGELTAAEVESLESELAAMPQDIATTLAATSREAEVPPLPAATTPRGRYVAP